MPRRHQPWQTPPTAAVLTRLQSVRSDSARHLLHQNIYGRFYHRSDAADSANAPFALGKTTIIWHFVNSYGTDSSECEQEVHIYTDTMLTWDCPTDTMKFSLTGGACTQEVTSRSSMPPILAPRRR